MNIANVQYEARVSSYANLKWAVEKGCDLFWCLKNRPIGVSENIVTDLYYKALEEVEVEKIIKTKLGKLIYV